jgi:hypothetical protein
MKYLVKHKQGNTMNHKLHAGVELVLEKMAYDEQQSSLGRILGNKYAEAVISNEVKEERGTENGNAEAGKNDETEAPTIEGGDCIKGLTISSDYDNAKTASQRSPLAQHILAYLGKHAADPTASLGTRAGDTTQTDELEPAKSVDKNPTAAGGDPAFKEPNANQSEDGGGLTTKTAGYRAAYSNKKASINNRLLDMVTSFVATH